MRSSRVAPVLLLLAAAVYGQPALAQGGDGGRFQIDRRGDSIIRLDRTTGAISTCTESGGGLDCRAGADERAALQQEIDRLAEEVDSLKARLAGAPDRGTGLSKDGNELTLKLPTEEEVRGVMSYLRDMASRLADAVQDLLGNKP